MTLDKTMVRLVRKLERLLVETMGHPLVEMLEHLSVRELEAGCRCK